MNAKKITLVQQLLAKAESTTPEEAEALTEAAERLMIKHGIDQAMIDARRASQSEPEKVVKDQVTFTGVHRIGLLTMGHVVVSAFGTMRTVRTRRGTTESLVIVGFESDVAQAKMLVESLHLQAFSAMSTWWRTFEEKVYLTDQQKTMAKRQFLVSFGSGAASRIQKATVEAVAETTGSALALRDRKAQVDEEIAEMYPKMSKARAMRGSCYGRSEGYAAGRSANTGGRSVSGSASRSLSR